VRGAVAGALAAVAWQASDLIFTFFGFLLGLGLLEV
jgi:hypothetical protein